MGDGPEGEIAYEYDAMGNRVATSESGLRTDHLIDPAGFGDVVAQVTAGGQPVKYAHGIGLASRVDDLGATGYYDFNVTGSTVGITGAAGDYLNQYSYLPFGEITTFTETIENPFQFVGQWGVMAEEEGDKKNEEEVEKAPTPSKRPIQDA